MNKCGYCESVAVPVLGRCSRCGAEMLTVKVAQPARKPKRKKENTDTSGKDLLIYFASGLLVITVLGSTVYFLDRIQPIPQPTVLYQAEAHSVVNKRAFVAIDEDSFNQMINSNDSGLGTLIEQKKIFILSASTRVQILDAGIGKSKIRILEGQHTGLAGWINNEAIN